MFKKIIKTIVIIFIFLLVAGVGYVSGNVTKYNLDVRKVDRAVDRFQGSLEEPYKKDIYGGKTPEETWTLYVDALKRGDIDLASKYFAVNRQEEERQELFQIERDEKLEELAKIYSQELKLEQKRSDKAYFYIVRENVAGEKINDSIAFYFNPYTKVWKIINL